MPTNIHAEADTAAALFGGSTEREAFEQTARVRADEPQTAPLLTATLSTWTAPIIVTVTICSAC
jgi:hypothetical protein